MFDKYNCLPDSMQATELREYFLQFIDLVNITEVDSIDATNGLLQLADRQWHTFEVIDFEIKKGIENWLNELGRTVDSEELARNITSIVAYLGLSRVFETIKRSYEDGMIVNPEVKRIIQETILELQGNVDDPYSGMK